MKLESRTLIIGLSYTYTGCLYFCNPSLGDKNTIKLRFFFSQFSPSSLFSRTVSTGDMSLLLLNPLFNTVCIGRVKFLLIAGHIRSEPNQ